MPCLSSYKSFIYLLRVSFRFFFLGFCCAWESLPHILHTLFHSYLVCCFVTIAVKLCLHTCLHSHTHTRTCVIQAFFYMGTWLAYVQVLTKFWTHAAAEDSDASAGVVVIVADAVVSVCAFFSAAQLSSVCVSCSFMQLLSRRGARSQVQFCPGSDSDSALFYCCHTTASAAATATATSASSSASLTLAACSSVRFSSVLVRLFGFRSHSGSNARLAWLVLYLIQTYVCVCPLNCCFSIM